MSSFKGNAAVVGAAAATGLAAAVGAVVLGFLLGRRSLSVVRFRQRSKNHNKPKSKQLILSYLDAKSAGEAIRLALFLSNTPFEDRRLKYAQIDRLRKSGYLPFGQVPALEILQEQRQVDDDDDDTNNTTNNPEQTKVHAQSLAILRWAGRQGQGLLYPHKDSDFTVHIDQVLEAVNEIKNLFRPAFYTSVLGRHPVSGEPLVQLNDTQCKDTLDALNTIVLPVRFGMVERLLQRISNGPLVCGGGSSNSSSSRHDGDDNDDNIDYNFLTIADLDLYVFANGILTGTDAPSGISPSVLDHCPRIQRLVQAVAQHPLVVEWNQRPTSGIATDAEIEKMVKRSWS